MRTVALDVETPNMRNDTICSIGICVFEEGQLKESGHYLVDPETDFDALNIRIHGIRPEDVTQAATFPELWPLHVPDDEKTAPRPTGPSAADALPGIRDLSGSPRRWKRQPGVRRAPPASVGTRRTAGAFSQGISVRAGGRYGKTEEVLTWAAYTSSDTDRPCGIYSTGSRA